MVSKPISEFLLEENRKPEVIEEKVQSKIKKLEEENKRLRLVKQDGLEKATRGIAILLASIIPAGIVLFSSLMATGSIWLGLEVTGGVALLGIAGYVVISSRISEED